jgi:hypothetical protein
MPTRAALALLAVAGAFVLAGCGSGGPPPQARGSLPDGRKPVIFEPGPNELTGDVSEGTLDELVSMGVNEVRMVVFWNKVLPARRPASFDGSDPDDPAYDFSDYDSFMRAASDRGLKVLVTVSGLGPDWTNVGRKSDAAPSVPAFADFAKAVATRYSGRFTPADGGGVLPGASMWSVWNEPNLSLFLKPQYASFAPYSPLLYRHLYIAGSRAIRRADPGVPILIGETAPTGSTDSVDPIPFARGVLCLDPSTASDPSCDQPLVTDGWATHPYQSGRKAPYEQAFKDTYVTMDSIDSLTSVLDEAAQRGEIAKNLPVYVTEYGIQSRPDPHLGVSLQRQAAWLSISEQLAYAYPRVKTFAQYLMRDDPPNQVPGMRYGGFESGLRFWDGPKKPSYDSFRLPLAVQRRGDEVTLWGLVRPATATTTAEIRVSDGGAEKTLRSVRTGPDGIFEVTAPYVQGRLWQLSWRSPSGETFQGPWTQAYTYSLPGGS